MAGYSKRTLVDKLGIKPGDRVLIVNAPPGYRETLGDLPQGAVRLSEVQPPVDFIHLFTSTQGELRQKLPGLRAALKPNGMFWVSWPKKAEKMPTDLTENIIREIAIENRLVDVKVAAVDETWSGLKLVIRLKDRPA